MVDITTWRFFITTLVHQCYASISHFNNRIAIVKISDGVLEYCTRTRVPLLGYSYLQPLVLGWYLYSSAKVLGTRAKYSASTCEYFGSGFPFLVFKCIFTLLSRESDQSAIRARLGVAGHLSTTPRWGDPAKCLFQWHNT